MKFSKGFTLSEILIAMLVLGIIVAASVPVILNLTPNKNAIMMKKAYYATESIIHSLINDQLYYPDMTANCLNPDGTYKQPGSANCYSGFDYRAAIILPVVGEVEGRYKLKCLFASKLNIKEDLTNVCNGAIDTVTTMDGMSWYIKDLDFMPGTGSTPVTLHIDVDGINKGVSAYNGTNLKACVNGNNPAPESWATTCNGELTNAKKKKFDRIQITISVEGKLSIKDGQDEFARIISGETKLIGGDDD